ncbi:Integrase [Pediococcus acidilactici]|uniref:tyrosine-type recombinase/integrase n=1 Tax=Pediococcus acidilactici TaxID=1254 RepID=UPI0007F049A5|nr:site-specific integrase [Pediococcus acidilactici]ARW24617.1 Integrase [Pediococcus acidilactici]ARW26659.1 Integrase [Pediococcus acidilactici]ARW28735.1 Integrase [Pediococcus acidilactici]OBR30932.1 Integrase [Pediococcus acidilactici]WDA27225.1 tyrosine-type recombinase/integrase [Pediococcus acidilactici]
MAIIKRFNKDGSYNYRVKVSVQKDGKRKNKSATVKGKIEARQMEAYLKAKLLNGEFDDDYIDKSIVFADYFWDWFELYKESSVTNRTYATYRQLYNNLKKYPIGSKTINSITRRDYQKFIKDFGKNHAKSTVSKFNSLLHACVKDAIYDEIIQKDFVRSVNLVFDKERSRKIDYLSIEETAQLSNYLLETKNPNFTSKYMILLAIGTGMRLGEIQALTWKDINFNFNTISINKSWNYEDGKFQSTKANFDRIIRINDTLIAAIKELKPASKKEMIFLNQYGTIPSSSAVNKTLKESLTACDIEHGGFHFHSLRHTHVAYLLSETVDLYVISKRLGHSDVSITSRVYSYLIDEYKQKSDLKIEKSVEKLMNRKPDKNLETKVK